MSQKELEQGDLEVMGMVNGHSHPDAAAAAQAIVEEATAPVQDSNDRACADDEALDAKYDQACREVEQMRRKHKAMATLQAALFVIACIVVAAALVAVLYVPELQIWVVNVGVLVCGIAAAVKIDKCVRWWR